MNKQFKEDRKAGREQFLGLAHIGIFTAHFEKTVEFYTKILPFEIVWNTLEEHPGDNSGIYPLKVCIAKLGDLYVELIETKNKGWTADGIDGTFNHIGIRVADIDDAIAELTARGLPPDRITDVTDNPYTCLLYTSRCV